MKLIKEIKKIVKNHVFDDFQLIKKINCLQLAIVIGNAAYNKEGEKYSLKHVSLREWQNCEEIIIIEGNPDSYMIRGSFYRDSEKELIRNACDTPYYTPNEYERTFLLGFCGYYIHY